MSNSSPKTMRHYIAGPIELMPELTALYSPTVNGYKRYVPGVWAPLTAQLGHRESNVRDSYDPGGASATRVEYRQTAADINPYIAMATCLAAGLSGIESKLDPPPPAAAARIERGSRPSPRTLKEATGTWQRATARARSSARRSSTTTSERGTGKCGSTSERSPIGSSGGISSRSRKPPDGFRIFTGSLGVREFFGRNRNSLTSLPPQTPCAKIRSCQAQDLVSTAGAGGRSFCRHVFFDLAR